MALADTWEVWIRRKTHLADHDHDHPVVHVDTQDPGLAAPDIGGLGLGLVLAPETPSAQRTPGKGMNVTKAEINTDTNVRAPGQVLHQARRTLIRSGGVVRRKTNTAVVRRRGKGREKRRKRKRKGMELPLVLSGENTESSTKPTSTTRPKNFARGFLKSARLTRRPYPRTRSAKNSPFLLKIITQQPSPTRNITTWRRTNDG